MAKTEIPVSSEETSPEDQELYKKKGHFTGVQHTYIFQHDSPSRHTFYKIPKGAMTVNIGPTTKEPWFDGDIWGLVDECQVFVYDPKRVEIQEVKFNSYSSITREELKAKLIMQGWVVVETKHPEKSGKLVVYRELGVSAPQRRVSTIRVAAS